MCTEPDWDGMLRTNLQEPRMLPPAGLRNQFDTSGRALAQYLPA